MISALLAGSISWYKFSASSAVNTFELVTRSGFPPAVPVIPLVPWFVYHWQIVSVQVFQPVVLPTLVGEPSEASTATPLTPLHFVSAEPLMP